MGVVGVSARLTLAPNYGNSADGVANRHVGRKTEVDDPYREACEEDGRQRVSEAGVGPTVRNFGRAYQVEVDSLILSTVASVPSLKPWRMNGGSGDINLHPVTDQWRPEEIDEWRRQ